MLPDEIKIRTNLLPGDLGYVAYLHGSLYAKECGYTIRFEKYVLEGLAEMAAGYSDDKDCVWIGAHEGTIVAFLAAVKREEGLQLRYFLIRPECRGMGLGRKMMELFMDFMRRKGYRKAFLWTTNEQQHAVKLYERFGFKLTEEKPSDAFGKPLVEQRYDLVL